MAKEIERKFLVKGTSWRRGPGKSYCQGYLSLVKERTVRVRTAGSKGYLTIKGKSRGATRDEFEYEIPLADAKSLLKMCEQPIIEKTRHRIPFADHVWEVDVFKGANRGLVVAEVELKRATEKVALPPWVGREVTHEPRYFNANLVKKPFRKW